MKRRAAKEIYTLTDLRAWENTDPSIRLGIFGDPVAHSLSPQMQNAALKACKIAIKYARFQISPDELPGALGLIRRTELPRGELNLPRTRSLLPNWWTKLMTTPGAPVRSIR